MGNDLRIFRQMQSGALSAIQERRSLHKTYCSRGYLQHKLIKKSQFISDKHENIDFLRLRRLEASKEKRRDSNFPQLSTSMTN